MAEPAKDTKEATVIGNDTHIKGEMTFKKSVRLVGSFEGKVTGDGELQIAENAKCKADIESPAVVIDGTLEGNLIAKDKVRLNAKGVIRGDIVAGKMVMSEGATFFGQCAIGADAVKEAGSSRPGSSVSTTPAPGQQGPGKTSLKASGMGAG
ncbi:MAG: bactofilin family protein [Planctomycetota bacterium]|jgi:cytoskeletal protein CcmA (bactofilin family)